MEKRFVATTRFARISPSKMKPVLDLIRDKDTDTAINILRYCPKRGAYFALKLLQSAIANATFQDRQKRLGVDFTKLHVVKAYATSGPTLKRTRPSSMKRPVLIRKRTSHITIVLEEKEHGA